MPGTILQVDTQNYLIEAFWAAGSPDPKKPFKLATDSCILRVPGGGGLDPMHKAFL